MNSKEKCPGVIYKSSIEYITNIKGIEVKIKLKIQRKLSCGKLHPGAMCYECPTLLKDLGMDFFDAADAIDFPIKNLSEIEDDRIYRLHKHYGHEPDSEAFLTLDLI